MALYKEYKDVLEPREYNFSDKEFITEKLYLDIEKYVKLKIPIECLAISLSGGVDSMVLIAIIKHLSLIHKFQVIGIHINYNNREESGREADFLKEWCIMKDIIFERHDIDHIKRGETKRSNYENESRDIRYNLYKTIIQKYNCPFIMLGHHKDDISENIFNNVCRGRNVLDLMVIKEDNIILGVPISRPMINHVKQVIYDFSHKYDIPYFRDTTPDWSCRGKMRRQIFPKCEDCYGSGFMSNLINIGTQVDEWSGLINEKFIQPFLQNVNYCQLGTYINISNYKNFPISFWNIVLKNIFYKFKVDCPSRNSIINFIEFINRNKSNNITLHKEFRSLLWKDYLIIIPMKIYNNTLRHTRFSCENMKDNIIRGDYVNYNINIEIVDYIECNYKVDLHSFLSGNIVYYIPKQDGELIINKKFPKNYTNQFKNIPSDILTIIPKLYYESDDQSLDNSGKYIKINIY